MKTQKPALQKLIVTLLFLLFLLALAACFTFSYHEASGITQTGVETEDLSRLFRQLPLLFVLLNQLLLSAFLMCAACRSIDIAVRSREKRGIALLKLLLETTAICLGFYLILSVTDIPNRFLPPQWIFDLDFYLKLPLQVIKKYGLSAAGVWSIGISGAGSVVFFLCFLFSVRSFGNRRMCKTPPHVWHLIN